MQKFLDSFSTLVDEKLKNPFINTFLISWSVFNWKPIFYLIFSNDSAEKKISVITADYSSVTSVIIYPFISTSVILIMIPLVLLLVEYILSFITNYRRNVLNKEKIQDITRNGEIAKEQYKMEDLLLIARKTGDVNTYIDNLKNQIKIYADDLSKEQSEKFELVKKHSEEIQNINSSKNRSELEISSNFKSQLSNLNKMLDVERDNVKSNLHRYHTLYDQFEKFKSDVIENYVLK